MVFNVEFRIFYVGFSSSKVDIFVYTRNGMEIHALQLLGINCMVVLPMEKAGFWGYGLFGWFGLGSWAKKGWVWVGWGLGCTW